MALICLAVHDTVENERFKYTKECLSSLLETVNFEKNKLVIIDNGSCLATIVFLYGFEMKHRNISVINLPENGGTAQAINLGITQRKPNEVVIKMDNDVVIHQSGWVEELEQAIAERSEIGICGLKRDDVYGEFTEAGKYLFSDDIMGTCTAFNPLLLDKVGYMIQPSVYGFDDVLMSARSVAAGFKNCFLPHIKITHLDDGKNPYCDWKRKEAGLYLSEVSIMCDMYKSGKLNHYYDGGFK